MENNNGRGIFYGVMGVATLVVAIVGATFAYFAASTNGTAGGVAANSASVAGTLKFAEVPDVRTNMIPTTEAIMKQSFAQSGEGAKAKCKGVSEADGTTVFDLCSTYEYTLTNDADIAQTVYMNFATVKNEFTNLQYCVYDGKKTTTAVVECGAVPAVGTPTRIGSVNLESKGSHTYTVVLFVNETTGDQTEADSGKSFTATVSASTSNGENNVTGVIAG